MVEAVVVDGAMVLATVVDGWAADVVEAVVVPTVVVVAALAMFETVDVVEACEPTCRAGGTSGVAPPIPALSVIRPTAPATPNSDAVQTPHRARRGRGLR